jgi:hypothetical protein
MDPGTNATTPGSGRPTHRVRVAPKTSPDTNVYGPQMSDRPFNAVDFSATGPFVLPSLALRWSSLASRPAGQLLSVPPA